MKLVQLKICYIPIFLLLFAVENAEIHARLKNINISEIISNSSIQSAINSIERRIFLFKRPTETPIPAIKEAFEKIPVKLGIHAFFNGNYKTTTRKLAKPVLSPRPSLKRIKFYLHHAFLASCPPKLLQIWNCTLCRTIGQHVQYITPLGDKKYGNVGLIAVDTYRKDIIVSFRGTITLPNVLLDLLWFSDSFLNDDPNEPIASRSLVDAYTNKYRTNISLIEYIVQILRKLFKYYPNFKVIIGGHSLGGGMATVLLFLLKHGNYFPNVHFELYTVGSPRTGNKGMADYLNSLSDTPMVRITNPTEPTPILTPAFLGFVHFNNEYHIYNNSGEGIGKYCSLEYYEDPTCSQGVSVIQLLFTVNLEHVSDYLGIPSIACAQDHLITIVLDLIFPLLEVIPIEVQDLLILNRPIIITNLLKEVSEFIHVRIYKIYKYYSKQKIFDGY